MGCCFSRTSDGTQPRFPDEVHVPVKARLPGTFKTHVGHKSSNCPPVPMEEETVKEVLSETPIVKPCRLQRAAQNKIREAKLKPVSSEMEGLLSKAEEGILSETSQVTELCSNMSGSISMATTISEQREDDEASSKRSRVTDRSMKPKIHSKRPYTGSSGPPSRREERDKRSIKNSHVTSRYTHGMESREGRTRKLNASVQQQSGINHVRRSRSPATRTAGGTRKTDNSKRSAMTPMKVIEQAGDQPEITTAEKRDKGKVEKPLEGAIQTKNECIENPVVSLECFIFL